MAPEMNVLKLWVSYLSKKQFTKNQNIIVTTVILCYNEIWEEWKEISTNNVKSEKIIKLQTEIHMKQNAVLLLENKIWLSEKKHKDLGVIWLVK